MPKSKYELIYKDLKDKIDRKEYKEGTFLPPENTLVQTIRLLTEYNTPRHFPPCYGGLCTVTSRKRRARHADSPTATAKV